MSLDTEIKGSPQQVNAAADWLTSTLVTGLDDAADDVRTARNRGESWGEDAGDAFRSRLGTTADTIDDISSDAGNVGRKVREWSTELKKCQDDMTQVRADAEAGGLTVSGFVVQDPGPGPARPDPTTLYDTQAEADAAWAPWNAHQDKVRVWNDCVGEAGRVRRRYETACQDLLDQVDGYDYALAAVNAESLAGEMARHIERFNYKMRLASAVELLETDAANALRDLQNAPPGSLGDRVSEWQRIEGERAAALRDLENPHARPPASDSPSRLGRAGRLLGPLGLVVGVASDLDEGESLTQAVVSQGGGALAGAAAGAGVGALIGSIVPGPGTAVGAVVGGVIGGAASIVTGAFGDGFIDSLFENGPDLGQAASEGWDSITDTVESAGDAIGDAAGGLVDGVKGLFG